MSMPRGRTAAWLSLTVLVRCGILSDGAGFLIGGDDAPADVEVFEDGFPPGIVAQGMPCPPFCEGMAVPMKMMQAPQIFMVQGPTHFGFDPWEDLHANIERVVHSSAGNKQLQLSGPGDDRAVALPGIPAQISQMMEAFGGQLAGHHGRTEGSFQVDDNPSRFRVSAILPGYNLGGDGDSLLAVKMLGPRSLVVSGQQTTHDGPMNMVQSWQRAFTVPKGSDVDGIKVTYNGASGNLTVEVPRRSGADADQGPDEVDEGPMSIMQDEMMPPAFRALQSGLPAIIQQLEGLPVRTQKARSFLMPDPGDGFEDMLGEVFGRLGQLHPRFQPPEGGEQPVPDDADVQLVGCFAESQLAKAKLKYYGESNAASFASMYWHARSDHVPYFGLARHESTDGHAFTFYNFKDDNEKPKWGDSCGSVCEDDETRWCGCANEADRMLPNDLCTPGEKRFAVYKIMGSPSLATADEAKEHKDEVETPLDSSLAQGHAFWRLSPPSTGGDETKAAPALEIVVPKGQTAEAKGREVSLFNAAPLTAPGSTQADAKPNEQDALVGKVRLPVDVSPDSCSWDGTEGKDEGNVLKCKLAETDVKEVPIRVVDEL
eukprot:gnl/TRDRNA2_/TRDRNA2_195548_c0_seq1.p1 gnl/TRDRNA2_/TRDRNA2_195548_c0~~gnl/TRDRNA2_/TRDRNA2_195548_c0_seq1.p1  ORF type:complete len:608 (+),score=119.79 gnl/TRDRNA2_/TRDRNA2_195548_c0_seq1:30-1826(+)